MNRVLYLALAAIVLCAILSLTPLTINTNYLTSEITSAFTSAVGLSRQFLRRALVSINVGQALTKNARDFIVEQLHTCHHGAKTLVTSWISVCRHIITDAIEEYPIIRSAEEYLVPQPSYENLTYHAERGACVWTYSSTGLPADFSPHTGTLFLLLATNVCTATLCFSLGAAIFAPLRMIWQGIRALASLVAKPEATWETFLEEITPPLAMLAAAVAHGIIFCATATLFCVGNLIVYAADLDIGFLKRPAPQVEEPKVFYRTIADPRVKELEEDNRKLERELDEKTEIWHSNSMQDAKRISGLLGENEVLENANMAQKLVIKGYITMHSEIDLKRPMYDQYIEEKKRCRDAQQDFNRVTEEKIALQADFWKQLDERAQEIRALKKTERSYREQNAALSRSIEFHQDRANRGDEVSRAQIECQKKRIKKLEGLEASQKQILEARVKELVDLVASHKANIESLEAQLKERDELVQALEARIKEQEARHSSEQQSQKIDLMKGFEEERSKVVQLSKASSDARKSAEETAKAADDARKVAEDALKVADEAREAAEQARKAEEGGRKKAEDDLAANLEARKAAEEKSAASLKALQNSEVALKAAEEARKTAEQDAALQKFRLGNRPYSQNKGTQTSSSPPGSPSTKPAGSSGKVPPPTTGAPTPPTSGVPTPLPPAKMPLPPPGQRPILKAKSVARKPQLNIPSNFNSYKSSIVPQLNKFSIEFSGGATPNTPETNAAASSSEPKNTPPAPSTEQSTNPPAGTSAPKPNTPAAAPSALEPTNLPPLPSTPELKTSPAPSTPEPANVSPLFSSPGSKTPQASSNPEPVSEPTPTEDSLAKPESPSGEQSEAPKPTAA